MYTDQDAVNMELRRQAAERAVIKAADEEVERLMNYSGPLTASQADLINKVNELQPLKAQKL